MKYLAMLLILVGCNSFPKYKTGDCTADNPDAYRHEFITEDIVVRKIQKVGKRNYLYKFSRSGLQNESEIFWFDRHSSKINCPEGF